MLFLKPPMPTAQRCVSCAAAPALESTGFAIPGLFVFADCRCPACGKRYWVHLPIGFDIFLPTTIEPDTGVVHSPQAGEWLPQLAAAAWQARTDKPVPVEFVEHRPVKRPLIVNCVENIYGHVLMKLYAVPRQIRENPDRDVIVIIQKSNAWLVPDGVAETWIVDVPLRQGHIFYMDLHEKFSARLRQWDEVAIAGSVIGEDIDITKFTRMPLFDYTSEAALAAPKATFLWREDRCWTYRNQPVPRERVVLEQAAAMSRLAETLRERVPDIDITVTGFGRTGVFPEWVKDWRLNQGERPDELAWLRLYSQSHVVFGTHGSNMLLPAAHAGSSVELLPIFKHGNIGQGYNFLAGTAWGQAITRYRFLPMSCSMSDIATILNLLIREARMTAFWLQSNAAPNQDAKYRLLLRHGKIFAHQPPIVVAD